MKHPQTRGERRAVRDGVISRRKRIVTRIWSNGSYSRTNADHQKWLTEMEWGKYAKFNLNCGCKQCHSSKYLSAKRKRRRARQTAESPIDFRRKDNAIK